MSTENDQTGKGHGSQKRRRALGRGLDALLSPHNADKTAEVSSDRIALIHIDQIKPNPNQARKTFDLETLDSLAQSIKTQGLLQPLLVQITKSGYQLIAGERRLRASKIAGIKEVPCIIRDYEERSRLAASLVENLQREDLNAIELAEGIKAMQTNLGLTQREIAAELAMSRPNIANTLRLLDLPESVQALIVQGAIPPGTGRALVALPDEMVESVAQRVIQENLTTRDTEALVRRLLEKEGKSTEDEFTSTGKTTDASPNIDARTLSELAAGLMKHLGTKVAIRKTKDGGRITLWFFSDEDLNRLLDQLGASENPL